MNLKKLVTAAVCTMLMAAVAFTAGCGGEKKYDKKVKKFLTNKNGNDILIKLSARKADNT